MQDLPQNLKEQPSSWEHFVLLDKNVLRRKKEGGGWEEKERRREGEEREDGWRRDEEMEGEKRREDVKREEVERRRREEEGGEEDREELWREDGVYFFEKRRFIESFLGVGNIDIWLYPIELLASFKKMTPKRTNEVISEIIRMIGIMAQRPISTGREGVEQEKGGKKEEGGRKKEDRGRVEEVNRNERGGEKEERGVKEGGEGKDIEERSQGGEEIRRFFMQKGFGFLAMVIKKLIVEKGGFGVLIETLGEFLNRFEGKEKFEGFKKIFLDLEIWKNSNFEIQVNFGFVFCLV